MGDTGTAPARSRTSSGQLVGDFAYVLTRVQTGSTFQYDLRLNELHTVPNIASFRGEELTLNLVASRQVRFTVQGGPPHADGLSFDLRVLGAPSEANTGQP